MSMSGTDAGRSISSHRTGGIMPHRVCTAVVPQSQVAAWGGGAASRGGGGSDRVMQTAVIAGASAGGAWLLRGPRLYGDSYATDSGYDNNA